MSMKTMAAFLAVAATMFNQEVLAIQQATRSSGLNLVKMSESIQGNYSEKASRAWIMRQEFLQRRDERKRRRSASVLSYRNRYPRRTSRQPYSTRQRREEETEEAVQDQVVAEKKNEEVEKTPLNAHQRYWQQMDKVQAKEAEGMKDFIEMEKDNIQRIKEEGDSL